MPRPVKITLIVLGIVVAIMIVGGQDLWALVPGLGGVTPRAVRIEAAVREEVIERVSSPAVVEPVTKIDISAEVSERIVELPYREGDIVKQGDVVVRLDDRDLQARYESAGARRDSSRSRLESELAGLGVPRTALATAKQKLERQKKLFESGDISRQALDDLLGSVAEFEAGLARSEKSISTLENDIAASEAEINRARRDLERCVMRSPIDGVVVHLNAEPGELVMVGTMNNAGTIIMSVADLSNMRLIAEVNESDIAQVQRGQPAEIRMNAYKGEVFQGHVSEVALQRDDMAQVQQKGNASDSSGIFEVRIGLNLAKGRTILSGLAANVEIEIAKHEGISVPSQAVLERKVGDLPKAFETNEFRDERRGTLSFVFLEVNGKAVIRPVKTGASSLNDTIISEGLVEGDRVITGPFKQLEFLKDGDAVKEDNEAKLGDDSPNGSSSGGGSGSRGSRRHGMSVGF